MATRCKDCAAEGLDPAGRRKLARKRNGQPQPGPRCVTHWRERRQQTRDSSHERHIWDTYGITAEEYQGILDAQGGACAICQRARGVKKRLSVDHCHATGLVRGLLCTSCNKHVLGQARDEIEFFQRAIGYLESPPAVAVIGRRITPDMREEDVG